MQQKPFIHVAIPAMNEGNHLPETLHCLKKQTYAHFRVWVCVNQPDDWWAKPEKQFICRDNQQTLQTLDGLQWEKLEVIDNASPGKGWKGKSMGVGIARKTVLDRINREANEADLMVSLDADTRINEGYLHSVAAVFEKYPEAVALSNPYYHELSGDEQLDRAMLRYEIYMRHYALNMWRIGSPYCFTALGSAIALPVKSYRKIGGMTPKKSGEDFYFLQKLRKTGWIANYNQEKVFPGTRYSDRVFFGTGPALIKGSQGNWESYPVYDLRLFNQVKETYDAFPGLYKKHIETPMTVFLENHFRCRDIFEPLRQNAATLEQFVKSCHVKIDGLRVLQFLKQSQAEKPWSDEENLVKFLKGYYPESLQVAGLSGIEKLDFATSPIAFLDKIRNLLKTAEELYQQNDHP